ncbi:NADP-dependent oxidoreductase [Dactylosporangium sp. AC04546]|uniref:NADP-dependent oxidoreductase n=1 Tax=Dactylosporangium sp. AC04546 TaxID=2862460 RepID=UPI001EDDA493|nr:NADP-dependent oxidoreductase [Dactylosporangium sp. AC04546]WVK87159.1 NADP-dependent oxidoreductase [Dactylosporangium sp. AC04546]
MKAMMYDTFGGPEVLHVADVPVPDPGPRQVRIRVHASGVNPVDSTIRSGAMQAIIPTTLPAIPGIDVAGVVDAVGADVTDVAVGEPVVGWADAPAGSYAEYALASHVARIPTGLSFADAATLPTAGETARRGLDLLGVRAGETVVIHGASGSVGTIAVQLAVARGATVIGTASEDNLDYVRSLGAIPVPYGEGLVDRIRASSRQVDAVFDVAGKGALPDSIVLRGGTDRIVTIADPAARELGVTFSAGTPKDWSAGDLAGLAELAAHGALTTAVAGTYPLERAAEVQRLSQGGHVHGKLVLIP